MDVLENFNDLGHNYDLLDDFLEDVWDFNQPLLVSVHCDRLLSQDLDCFKDLLNDVDVPYYLFEFLHDDFPLDDPLDLLDSFVLVPYLDYLLVLPDDLFDLLNDDGHFDDLLHNFFDISIYIHQLRNDLLYLKYLGNLNQHLSSFLHLLNFWDCDRSLNNFLDNLLGSNNLLHNWLHRHNFLSLDNHLFDLFVYIWNLFDNFLNSLVDNNLFLNPDHFLDHDLFDPLGDNLLNNLRDLYYFLNNLCDWNNFLYDLLDWDRDFNWDDDLPFEWIGLGHFHWVIDWLFYLNDLGDLPNNLNYFLHDDFVVDDLLFVFGDLHDFVIDSLHLFLYVDVHVLHCLNLYNPLLDHGDLHYPLDLLDLLLNYDLLDDPFDDLGHFHYLLDHPGDHDDPLYDLLDFDHLGHLDHLLNDLFDRNSNLLDPVHVPDDLNDFLLYVFDGLGHLDVVVYYLLYFHNPGLSDYLGLPDIHFFDDCLFWSLNDGLLDYLYHLYDLLVEDWHLHYPLDLLDDLGHGHDGPVNIYFYFLDPVLEDYLFLDHGDFVWLLDDSAG